MRTILYLFFVSTLFFFSCTGTKRMANEKASSFTEEEFTEALKGTLKLPETMSSKEKEMRLKLKEIYVYHLLVDTIQEEIRLDLSPKVCADLGLPASAETILRDVLQKEIENTKKRGKQYYSWYLKSVAKIIAAERLKGRTGDLFLTPLENEAPPQ